MNISSILFVLFSMLVALSMGSHHTEEEKGNPKPPKKNEKFNIPEFNKENSRNFMGMA
uniref:Uncharacterized protein n=1 Tax=Lepeophtheirus salmonis TaxID=72036 RepID=A0A0K2TDG1_LEPSM